MYDPARAIPAGSRRRSKHGGGTTGDERLRRFMDTAKVLTEASLAGTLGPDFQTNHDTKVTRSSFKPLMSLFNSYVINATIAIMIIDLSACQYHHLGLIGSGHPDNLSPSHKEPFLMSA